MHFKWPKFLMLEPFRLKDGHVHGNNCNDHSAFHEKYKYTPKVISYCSVSNDKGQRCTKWHGFLQDNHFGYGMLSPNCSSIVLHYQISLYDQKTSARTDDIRVQVGYLKNIGGTKKWNGRAQPSCFLASKLEFGTRYIT